MSHCAHRILLTGRSGQLGEELIRILGPIGELVSPGREELDLTDGELIRSLVRAVRPSVIVNAAAYTAVDQAESDEPVARAVNSIAPGILAEEAERIGALLVHFSTDYVFDGEASDPRTELDATNPLSVYGRTKLEGEEAVRAHASRHLILRTGWLYGARGRNFLRTMLRAGSRSDELKVVDDQVGSPTWTRHLAVVTATLASRILGGSFPDRGLYHVTSSGQTSWWGFAAALIEEWFGPEAPIVTPIKTSEWPTAARRPVRSVLSCDALEAASGLRLPNWKDALSPVIEDLRHSADAATWVRSPRRVAPMLEGPILVTGGSGFIGSALVRRLTADGQAVVNVDKLTYAASPDSLRSVHDSGSYKFEHMDVCDRAGIAEVLRRHRPRSIFHLAAETHVDRSIDAPAAFIETNVVGTYVMLEAADRYRATLPPAERDAFRFVHVSTDEVFGSLGDEGVFHADTPYDPRSPYSASKAAADHLARAWQHTYDLPVVVTNTCNNFGPFQFPEKLIPLTILNALDGKPIRVYGRGLNTREWIFVDDHVEALIRVMEAGQIGSTYLIGSGTEMTNIEVVRHLCAIVDRLRPGARPAAELITYVPDRPGHDFRYALDSEDVRTQLGWAPRRTFLEALEATVEWYADNREWCAKVQGDRYDGGRLGLAVGGGTR